MTNKKEQLIKALKIMDSGDVMSFVSKQMGVNPFMFLAKNAGRLALTAVKSGWVKAGNIGDAMKDFSAKNAEDTTGIDWDSVKIDEDAVKLTCLFDRDSGKKLKEFVKKLSDKMVEFAKDENELDESSYKLTEAETLYNDPANKLAVTLLQCFVSLSKNKNPEIIKDMWITWVAKYFLEKGVHENMSDIKKIALGQMTSNDEVLNGMCSIFSDFKNARGPTVISKVAEYFKYKDLMDLYGDKFKSAIKFASTVRGNTVFKDAIAIGSGEAVSAVIDAAKTPKEAVAAAGEAKGAAKEMANDEDLKKEVSKKSGIPFATALGWARVAAKTTGYVLNHGKDVVDALGAKKIKNQEDKNVIAEIRVQLENAGDDQKYSDSEFSVRFTADDFKWHATCIDDRKMKFPEDALVQKVLATDTAKEFKQFCLKKWNGIFRPAAGSDYQMLPFILQNIDKFGLKGADASFFEKVKAVADNMDQIESVFK